VAEAWQVAGDRDLVIATHGMAMTLCSRQSSAWQILSSSGMTCGFLIC
jgi:hypothetical protein